MVTHQDIGAYIESLAPPPGGDEGFRYGDPQAQTSGVLVCWMTTLEALTAAAEADCNLVVTHEQLHYPYNFRQPELENALTWGVNRRRLSILARHDLTVYRAHGQLDRFCILDDFAEAIGMPAPSVREGYFRIHDFDPISVGKLARQVKARLGVPHVRVSGNQEQLVRRAGLPWGGLGLSVNVSFINGLLEHGPDVLIAGECDEYAFRFTEDAGVPMIETGHSVSENMGLAHFAEMLGAQFGAVPVIYHEVPCPWQTV